MLAVMGLQYVSGIALQRAYSRKKTKLVTSIFGKYVSKGVVEDILKGEIGISLESTLEAVAFALTRFAHNRGRNDQTECIERHPGAVAVRISDPVGLQDAIVVPDYSFARIIRSLDCYYITERVYRFDQQQVEVSGRIVRIAVVGKCGHVVERVMEAVRQEEMLFRECKLLIGCIDGVRRIKHAA